MEPRIPDSPEVGVRLSGILPSKCYTGIKVVASAAAYSGTGNKRERDMVKEDANEKPLTASDNGCSFDHIKPGPAYDRCLTSRQVCTVASTDKLRTHVGHSDKWLDGQCGVCRVRAVWRH